MHMIHSGRFRDKKILLIDQQPQKINDRTWCFWEMGEGLFESIVYRKWQKLWFSGEQFSRELDIAPYHYKMIRGIDFYEFCLDEIRKQPNFEIRFGKVDHVFSSDITTGIMTEGKPLHCEYVFNSILFEKPELTPKQYWLLQHFKGWVIETPEKRFEVDRATMMDFGTNQQEHTAFCYVLPFSPTRALVEYTVFSPELLPEDQYNRELERYLLEVLKIPSYTITEEEFGVIPMTNFRFSPSQNKIINIGTAGGQTKASSGYTFNFIQKHSRELVSRLVSTGHPSIANTPMRFSFYDSVLLHILFHKTLKGKTIFTDLFQRNPVTRVLKFLDNETSLPEEIRLISTLPTWPFAKAAIRQIF